MMNKYTFEMLFITRFRMLSTPHGNLTVERSVEGVFVLGFDC